MTRVLALDRGNAALKAALFVSGVIRQRRRLKAGRAGEVAILLRRFQPDGLAVSCVVPAWREAVENALGPAWNARCLWAGYDSPLPFELDVDHPSSVGADRLSAAAAVVASGLRSAVIVDAGTAVTVDILAGGVFRGGSIIPGPALMLRALHRGTAALPMLEISDLEPDVQDRFPGRNTRDAIRAGVFNAYTAAVAHLVRRSLERIPGSGPVYVTGAGAALLAGCVHPPPVVAPDLVLEGLNYLFMKQFHGA